MIVQVLCLIGLTCVSYAQYPRFASQLIEKTLQDFDYSIFEEFFTKEDYNWYTSGYAHMIKHHMCHPDAVVTYVPVYYMPSHTVVLDCAACSQDKLESEGPRIWRTAFEENFFNGLNNLADKDIWVTVDQAMAEINANEIAGTFMNERQTTARQSGSRLYLIGATPFAGGLYSCDVADSPRDSIPEVIYMVMPMVIPTRLHPLMNWRATEVYFPYLPIFGSFLSGLDKVLWGWNWMWTAMLYPVTSVRNASAVPMWNDIQFPVVPPLEFDLPELADDYNTSGTLESMNLRIDNEWGEWSTCSACSPNNGRRTREGHCVLKRIRSADLVVLPKHFSVDMNNLYAADSMVAVVTDLNILFNRAPLATEGIRCWSLPIVAAGVRSGADPPCLRWLKPPHKKKFTWHLESHIPEMVTKRFDPTSGCAMWFHSLFHEQFGRDSDVFNRADNPFYPFKPQQNFKPDWRKLSDPESTWQARDHEDWLNNVLIAAKVRLNSPSLPVCGSAGYYIDFEDCQETECTSG